MTTEQKTIEVTYEDQPAVYNIRSQKWTWMGFDEEQVKALNPDKHKKITSMLQKDVGAYQDRVKREDEERKAKALAERAVAIEAWKSEVSPLIPVGYEASYPSVENSYRDIRGVTIKKDGVDASIGYEPKVYRGSYYGSTTTSPWVMKFGYNFTHRYATLQAAIKSAIKKIDEKIEIDTNKKKAEGVKADKQQSIGAQLKKEGITLVIKHEYKRDVYGHCGHSWDENWAMVTISGGEGDYDRKVAVSGRLGEDDKGNIVVHGAVIKGDLNINQFKALAEFVKTLGLKEA